MEISTCGRYCARQFGSKKRPPATYTSMSFPFLHCDCITGSSSVCPLAANPHKKNTEESDSTSSGVRTHLLPPRPPPLCPTVQLIWGALAHVPHLIVPASRLLTHTSLSAVLREKTRVHSHVQYTFIFLFIRLVCCFALLQDSLSASFQFHFLVTCGEVQFQKKKVTVSALLCEIGIKSECFFWLCLSLHACLLCSCRRCVCLCASHCFFFSSDRNKAWPGGNCRYLPITTRPPLPSPNSFPTLTGHNVVSDVFPTTTLPSQDSWGLAMTPPPPPFPLSFRIELNFCPNIWTSAWNDNIGNATS